MSAETLDGDRADRGELQTPGAAPPEEPVFTPPVDIHESDEGLTLEADLPGVLPETLDIEINDNVLRIIGRVAEHVPDGAEPVYEEYTSGSYVRSFILSDEIDREKITAALCDGVLRLVLPKAQRARPQRIEVRSQ